MPKAGNFKSDLLRLSRRDQAGYSLKVHELDGYAWGDGEWLEKRKSAEL